jgi:hypothetical protein
MQRPVENSKSRRSVIYCRCCHQESSLEKRVYKTERVAKDGEDKEGLKYSLAMAATDSSSDKMRWNYCPRARLNFASEPPLSTVQLSRPHTMQSEPWLWPLHSTVV